MQERILGEIKFRSLCPALTAGEQAGFGEPSEFDDEGAKISTSLEGSSPGPAKVLEFEVLESEDASRYAPSALRRLIRFAPGAYLSVARKTLSEIRKYTPGSLIFRAASALSDRARSRRVVERASGGRDSAVGRGLSDPPGKRRGGQILRISIGETRCLRERIPDDSGLLNFDDLKAYAHFECAFYRLEFSLTILPGRNLSIEHAELSLELEPDNKLPELPFFVRLHPPLETAPEKITIKQGAGGRAEIKVPTIGTVGAGVKQERESEVLRQAVTLSSWGAGEQSGGWRFHSTAAQLIDTNITGLTALVAIPGGRKAMGRLRASAQLKSGLVDGFLRGIFFQPPPEACIEYDFPPTIEKVAADPQFAKIG
jgi:hypothetical protein